MKLNEQAKEMMIEFMAGLPDETRDIIQQAFAPFMASQDGALAL